LPKVVVAMKRKQRIRALMAETGKSARGAANILNQEHAASVAAGLTFLALVAKIGARVLGVQLD